MMIMKELKRILTGFLFPIIFCTLLLSCAVSASDDLHYEKEFTDPGYIKVTVEGAKITEEFSTTAKGILELDSDNIEPIDYLYGYAPSINDLKIRAEGIRDVSWALDRAFVYYFGSDNPFGYVKELIHEKKNPESYIDYDNTNRTKSLWGDLYFLLGDRTEKHVIVWHGQHTETIEQTRYERNDLLLDIKPALRPDITRKAVSYISVMIKTNSGGRYVMLFLEVGGTNTQIATQTASINTGEDAGTSIWNDIVEGISSLTGGNTESGGNDGLSTAAKVGVSLGGALATAGALSAASGGKNKNNKDGAEEEKKKTYKMKVFKNFGDSIKKGSAPVKVWARIVEIEEGVEKTRDDLTAKISASGEGMNVRLIGMRDSWQGAEVTIPSGSEAQTATLIFIFSGKGGVMHNRITFRVLDVPEIIFIDPETLGIYDRRESREDLLIGDSQGTVLLIGLKNFFEKPKNFDFQGQDMVISYESITIDRYPDMYTYQITIQNTLRADSPYGIWPLERELIIIASNSAGDRAEGMLECQLWPEGIFFDTRQLYPKQIREESNGTVSILLDTSEIYLSAGGVNNMENACMDTGVAFKDPNGLVVVDRPNEPSNYQFFRLQPADVLSEKVLDPFRFHIWYDLKFCQKPSYHTDNRLGTLWLDPLMPLVVSNEKAEYHGKFMIFYIKGSQYFDSTVQYGFTGINKEMNDADRKTEIKRINKLLDRMMPDDMIRVLDVFRKYGAEAEQVRDYFGTERTLCVLEQTEQELRDSLDQIQSLQRLRFMRKMVYEALNEDLERQKWIADSFAMANSLFFWCAKSARYAADLGFTVWCYLMFNKYGAAIEPIASSIKDLFLDYISEVFDYYKIKQGTVQNPIEFFNSKRLTETMMEAIGNTLLNLMVVAAVDGGRGPMTWSEIWACGGSISAFVFAKNYWQYTEINQKGEVETEWWNVFKGTMADISINTLKAVASVAIGRYLNKYLDPYASEERINIVRENLAPKIKQAVNHFLDKNPTCGMPTQYWTKFIRYCKLKNVMHSRFSAWLRFHFEGVSGKYAFNELAHDQHHAILEYILLAIFGHTADTIIDVKKEERDWQAAEAKIDNWAKSFDDTAKTGTVTKEDGAKTGTVMKEDGAKTVTVTNEDGEEEEIEIPFMVKISLFIENTFKMLGLTEKTLDFSNLLPKECPFWIRERIIEEIGKFSGTQKEKEFLKDPEPFMKKDLNIDDL